MSLLVLGLTPAGATLVGAVDAAAKKSGEAVKSGPIGLGIILILCVACYFLFKSMSKHLRTVREEFPTEPPSRAVGSGASAAGPDQRPAGPDGAGEA